MCGIVGYVGDRECKELLLTGLERLEYRGYDSAGICLINGEVDITRRVGKVQVLRDAIGDEPHTATTGLAHTRWATHGGVTEQNAHPIEACEGSGVTVVHNGIIENYQELRRELAEAGHVFHSDTDTEVIAHLVEEMYEGDLVEAAQRAYARLRGHFAIAVAHRDHPHMLVGARRQCPLVVGVGDNEMFMASAIPAFLSETRRVQYVEDDEIVIARPGGAVFLNGTGSEVEREVEQVDWDEDAAEKQGYETFMLKEIEEQPDAIAETIGERLYRGELHLDGLELSEERIRNLNRIVILACGTSYHAGLIGRYLLEEWARVPSESDIASEWRYRHAVIDEHTLVIAVAQSGETIDTLAAMKEARSRGAHVLAITNVMGSQMTRQCDSVLYTRAGLEIGVAATKTFTAQVTLMYLLALKLGLIRGTIDTDRAQVLLDEVRSLPDLAQSDDRPRTRPAAGGRAVLGERVLPLSGPKHRSSDRAGGRAQAEGDLLHRHRCICGGRDETRAHRAARRSHPGGRDRDRQPRLREGRVQHRGGTCPRRACDRGRDRRQHPDRVGGRACDLAAANRAGAPGGSRDHSIAAVRLSRRAPAGSRSGQAPQPGEDCHS